jgi:hypothetical protein
MELETEVGKEGLRCVDGRVAEDDEENSVSSGCLDVERLRSGQY